MISANNETMEICMNDVVSKDGYEVNLNVQIESSRNPEKGNEKIMKENLKKLHAQRKILKPHGRTSYVGIFYCVTDNAQVDFVNTQ
jgi:hypothetical protein